MAFPTLVFNSSGSDTVASGAGPSSALTGVLAATHANTTVNITDAVDLSGVAVDGTACLWVVTSSGRRWSRITAISGSSGAWVVTVGDAYGTTQSGATWAIGGKRATLDGSTQLGLDVRGGWTIDIQTDQTITSNFRLTPNAVAGSPFTITSTVGTMATKIQTATNSINGLDVAGASSVIINNLYLKTTAATPADGIGCASNAACTNIIVKRCILDGWLNGIRMGDSGGNARLQSAVFQGLEIKNCTQNGIWNQISGGPEIVDCYIHDNGSASSGGTVYPTLGVGTSGGFAGGVHCRRTVFANNKGPALFLILSDPAGASSGVGQVAIEDCVLYKNCALGGATAGIMGDIHISSSGASPVFLENCILYGSAAGNFAFKVISSNVSLFFANNNAFGVYTVNFSGTGLSSGNSPITLTADPFTSSTDFALNNTSGAGALCKGAGIQGIPNATSSTALPDVGAIQSAVTAAVGSTIIIF